MSDKHEGFLPGDHVKVYDVFRHENSIKTPQIGVVLEVAPSGGILNSQRVKVIIPGTVTWRWGYEIERL